MLDAVAIFNSNRFRRLSREGSWILLGQGATVVGSLVGVRLLTELLEPSVYGKLTLAMTVSTLVNQTIFGPLSNGATRFYSPSVEKGDLPGFLNATRRLVVWAVAIVLVTSVIAAVGLFLAKQPELSAIAAAASIFAIVLGCNSILNGMQNAARQRAIVALHQGMETWGRFLMAAVFILWLGASASMAIVGQSFAIILVLASQYLFFRKTTRPHVSRQDRTRDWLRRISSYSWPFASWGVFYWAQSASDRWALSIFANTTEVGLYAVLFQLGYYPISMVTGMAMQLFAPIFFQRMGDASDVERNASVHRLGWNLTWIGLGATVVAFVVALLFHAQLFRILVAPKYTAMSYLLPWMLLSGGLFAAGQALALNLMSQMQTHTMVVAKISTALVGVLLNFAGAYLFGVRGVVAASVLFSLAYSLWIAILARRVTSVQTTQ